MPLRNCMRSVVVRMNWKAMRMTVVVDSFKTFFCAGIIAKSP